MSRTEPSTSYRVTLLTLFPDFFESPLATSLLGKAIGRGEVVVERVNPRDFTADKHRTVDDAPYGGGPGMVLKAAPMVAAIESARASNPDAPVVLLGPAGQRLDAGTVARLADKPGIVLVCGRYEGFDDRVRHFVDAELSVGDYVLSGGEPAALVVLDAISRHLEGVLGNRESVESESFAEGLLEYPQYTRPPEFRQWAVPEVLLSGDHGRIRSWRRAQALALTRDRRPDLFEQLVLSEDDRELLRELADAMSDEEIDDGRETNHLED